MKPVSCGLQLGWEVSAASGLRILGVWDSGVSENRGTVPYFGVLIVRILLFRVLYLSPVFSETPIYLILSPNPKPYNYLTDPTKSYVRFLNTLSPKP